MKKTILSLAIISALLVSCNETKNKEVSADAVDTVEEVHENHDADMASHELNNAWVNDIKLDSGSKWDANIETTEGVDKMLNMLKVSETKTVEDYHSLAAELNEVKNFVVKECTMKGPSHDNLHVFLHPLIDKIAALGKVSTVEEGGEIKKSIKENLDGYYDYFQ